MAWGASDTSTQLTSITTVQYFDDTPQIPEASVAHCQVEVNFPGSPTDDALIRVDTTLDASTEVWDVEPYAQYFLSNSDDPNRLSFVVTDVYKFRVGVERSGTTDTLTSADFKYRLTGQ